MNIWEESDEPPHLRYDPLSGSKADSDTPEHGGLFLIWGRNLHGFRRPSIFVAPISRDGNTVLGIV